MKNKKLLSTLVLASVLTTGFMQPLSAKANPLDKDAILANLKQSSGKEFKMSEQGTNQKSLSGKLSKRKSADSNEALNFLDEFKDVLSLKDVNKNFAVKSVKKDDLGFTNVVFNQIKNGMDVDKNTVSVHFNRDNVITNVTTNIDKNALDSTVSTTKNVSQENALETVKNDFKGKNPDVKFVSNKVIDNAGKLLSTYMFSVSYTTPEVGGYRVYVDMNTGKVAKKINTVQKNGAVTGSGTAVNGTKRSLNLYQSGSQYEMRDTTKEKPVEIITYTDNETTNDNGTLITSPTKTINDSAAVSAHAYAGVVYDFYKKLFNRNSIDDKGMSIKSNVHFNKNWDNAEWNSETRQMYYGDGSSSNGFKAFSADLDVVGHEMTHGVTTCTADLNYVNQSGALNESMSDVMGVLIETWDKYNVQNGGNWQFNDSDWVVGDEICTSASGRKAFRSLKDPTLFGQPDSMSSNKYFYAYFDPYTMGQKEADETDVGGVHLNSGVPNKAAYLVAKSIGCEKVAKIYYRALSQYFNADTNFVGAYYGLAQAATDLYGADSDAVKALTSAYTSVGVLGSEYNDDSFNKPYPIETGSTYISYISRPNDTDNYKIYVPQGRTLNLALSNLPNDYDLYLYDKYGRVVAKSVNGKTESELIKYKSTRSDYYTIRITGYRNCYSATKPYTLDAVVNK